MNIRFKPLVKIAAIVFLIIAILRIWFNIPYAIAAIPLLIQWLIIPVITWLIQWIKNLHIDNKGVQHYYGQPLHWNPKTGNFIEDEGRIMSHEIQ